MLHRNWLRALVVTSLALGACGGDAGSAADREAQLEDYAARYGQDVDVEVQGQGEDERVAVNTGTPGMQGQVGTDLDLPDDFPDDVAVYPALKIHSTAKVPMGYTLGGQTVDGADEVAAHFERDMLSHGWTAEQGTSAGTTRSLRFSKNGRSASLTTIVAGGTTNVQLAVVDTN